MKRVTCTLYSTWCIMICLVISILSLLLFIQSLYSLSKLQLFSFTCIHSTTVLCDCSTCSTVIWSLKQNMQYDTCTCMWIMPPVIGCTCVYIIFAQLRSVFVSQTQSEEMVIERESDVFAEEESIVYIRINYSCSPAYVHVHVVT